MIDEVLISVLFRVLAAASAFQRSNYGKYIIRFGTAANPSSREFAPTRAIPVCSEFLHMHKVFERSTESTC